MAITKKPNRNLSEAPKPDPMAFIRAAEHRQADQPEEPDPQRRKRKEPVIIRFDEETLERVDQAAAKRGLSRAALVRMLVLENLPD